MQGFGRALSPIWYWRIPVIGQYLDGFGWPRFRINQLIRRAVQHHHPTAPVGDTAGSLFVRRLYQLMIKANGNLQLTEDRVMGNVLTLFIAGIDTTANMLAVCLYILARDTVLQQKIRQHVQNIKIDTVTIDNFYETMPLLKSFLHEIHRMYGNVFLMLELKKDIDFAGVILPMDSACLFSPDTWPPRTTLKIFHEDPTVNHPVCFVPSDMFVIRDRLAPAPPHSLQHTVVSPWVRLDWVFGHVPDVPTRKYSPISY